MCTGLLDIVLFLLALGAHALTPSHHLTSSDVDRLQATLNQPFKDLKSAYFSIVGLSKLGVSVTDSNVRILAHSTQEVVSVKVEMLRH